jgi:hypothetical protein
MEHVPWLTQQQSKDPNCQDHRRGEPGPRFSYRTKVHDVSCKEIVGSGNGVDPLQKLGCDVRFPRKLRRDQEKSVKPKAHKKADFVRTGPITDKQSHEAVCPDDQAHEYTEGHGILEHLVHSFPGNNQTQFSVERVCIDDDPQQSTVDQEESERLAAYPQVHKLTIQHQSPCRQYRV